MDAECQKPFREEAMAEARVEQVLSCERQRCEAISKGDLERLAGLLAEDLTHTHITGHTDNKVAYLAAMSDLPRKTTRGDDLRVRLYGETAVMTGSMQNTFPAREPGGSPIVLELHALQVWVEDGDAWHLAAFASSGQIPEGVV
jgi:ketosteroid isomerase-like protein